MTLAEFVESLAPRYPEAAQLVASSTSKHDLDPEEWNALRLKPLHDALPDFLNIILFQPSMDGIDADVDPGTDTDEELRKYYKEKIAHNHRALQQLEAALRELGIGVKLDQSLSLSEYCVDQGIAKQGPDGTLIFSE